MASTLRPLRTYGRLCLLLPFCAQLAGRSTGLAPNSTPRRTRHAVEHTLKPSKSREPGHRFLDSGRGSSKGLLMWSKFRSSLLWTSKCLVTGLLLAFVMWAAVSAASWAAGPAEGAKPPYFRVAELPTLGGTQASAYGINDLGWVTGAANVEGDRTEHAVLWRDGAVVDLDKRGSLNSSAGFPFKNNLGLIAVLGQTPTADALGENWNFTCTLSGDLCEETNHVQRGFLWVAGINVPMPTLGGNNGSASGVNDLGEVVGLAETATVDPNCVAPQILDFEAVVWNPWTHKIEALPNFPGDSVGAAVAINDRGQAVGASGSCAPVSPALAAHALLWQNGSVTYLGGLGGTFSNVAYDINNFGQVVGVSGLPGDATAHAFLWEKGTMTDLGTLPGDFLSVAFAINDGGQVVGQSCDQAGNCRADRKSVV